MKGKILVVDDESTTRSSLAEILRLEGYHVETAANGEQALDRLDEQTYDLMLLDIIMPGIDGIEVLHRVGDVAPDMGIILLTAHGSLESAIDALRYSAQDYLLKPSAPHEIIESVNRSIAKHSEVEHRRRLLDQLESSLSQLKTAEGMDKRPMLKSSVVTIGDDVKVDLDRRVIWQGEIKIQLTPTEGKLMQVLLEQQGRVLSHKELVLMVQGYNTTDWEAPEILRPLVSRLRRKLATFKGGKRWITNVRGTGYVFDGEESA